METSSAPTALWWAPAKPDPGPTQAAGIAPGRCAGQAHSKPRLQKEREQRTDLRAREGLVLAPLVLLAIALGLLPRLLLEPLGACLAGGPFK